MANIQQLGSCVLYRKVTRTWIGTPSGIACRRCNKRRLIDRKLTDLIDHTNGNLPLLSSLMWRLGKGILIFGYFTLESTFVSGFLACFLRQSLDAGWSLRWHIYPLTIPLCGSLSLHTSGTHLHY